MSDDPLPKHVRQEIAEALLKGPSRKRGRKKVDNFHRDLALATAVFKVSEKFGFRPTRNRVSKSQSACSIVAEACRRLGYVHLTEEAPIADSPEN